MALGVIWPPVVHAGTEQVVAADDIRADVAVDAHGTAFLVSRTRSSVRLRVAAPTARFGPSRTLYSSPTDRAVDAAVAADGTGVIVIQSRRRQFRRVRVAAFSADGSVASLGRRLAW